MAQSPFPPGLRRYAPPPPWFSFRPPPPPPPFSYKRASHYSRGGVITAGVFVGLLASVVLSIMACSCCRGRSSRARATAATAEPQPLRETSSVRVDERPLRHGGAASTTAGLPAFTYTLSVKHNVTGAGEEAATCSVCLGALQLGETVRLLPVCLHLYHAECIDPWVDEHSTCPICRSETDPTMGV